MRILIATVAATAGLTGAAFADAHTEQCFDKGTLTYVDCPTEPVVTVTPPPPVDIWDGFYIGAHAGYADLNVDGVHDGTDALPLFYDAFETTGYTLGGQIGFLEQLDSDFVVGLELDASYVAIDDAITNGEEAASLDSYFMGSLRARAGYAFGVVMPYVTGGVGLVGYEADLFDNDNAPATASIDEMVFTGVIGGGLEVMAFDNISIRGEGLYHFFDDQTDLPGVIGDADPGDSLDVGGMWTLRGAINVHF